MLPDRIESKIDRSGECHLWTGHVRKDGYGAVWFKGKADRVHRVVYALEVGPIPPGMTIDHVKTRGCTSRACVRLEHLEVVTMKENALRAPTSIAARNAAKTRCPKGHPYDARDKRGRYCRECHNAWDRENRLKS